MSPNLDAFNLDLLSCALDWAEWGWPECSHHPPFSCRSTVSVRQVLRSSSSVALQAPIRTTPHPTLARILVSFRNSCREATHTFCKLWRLNNVEYAIQPVHVRMKRTILTTGCGRAGCQSEQTSQHLFGYVRANYLDCQLQEEMKICC